MKTLGGTVVKWVENDLSIGVDHTKSRSFAALRMTAEGEIHGLVRSYEHNRDSD